MVNDKRLNRLRGGLDLVAPVSQNDVHDLLREPARVKFGSPPSGVVQQMIGETVCAIWHHLQLEHLREVVEQGAGYHVVHVHRFFAVRLPQVGDD